MQKTQTPAGNGSTHPDGGPSPVPGLGCMPRVGYAADGPSDEDIGTVEGVEAVSMWSNAEILVHVNTESSLGPTRRVRRIRAILHDRWQDVHYLGGRLEVDSRGQIHPNPVGRNDPYWVDIQVGLVDSLRYMNGYIRRHSEEIVDVRADSRFGIQKVEALWQLVTGGCSSGNLVVRS